MSSVTVQQQTGNVLHVDYDLSKIFIGNNDFLTGTFINDSGDVASFAPGTLLARNATTGNLKPLRSGDTTVGQNIPVGILASTVTDLADDGTVTVTFCVGGEVALDKVILQGSDTLDTVVSDRRIRDRILGDTGGIFLKEGEEQTDYDNA